MLLLWALLLAERKGLLRPSLPPVEMGRAALGIYVWHYLAGLNLIRLLGVGGKVSLRAGLPLSLLCIPPFWAGARLWLRAKGRVKPIIGRGRGVR